MKAAWYEKIGSAEEVLEIGEAPIPDIKPNEVLIRLHTSGVNPSDVKMRRGIREKMPFPQIIPHSDGAGIIEKVGAEISHNRIGQRVWTYNARWQRAFGTAAEFVVLPAALAIPLPDVVSFEAGACLGIPALTAHRCVFVDGNIEGKTVLVTGGAGSVGYYAIQFAKWGGATVIATVSNPEKARYAKEAGADYILNYRKDNIVEKVHTLTDNKGVDHIVEVDFGRNLAVTQDILKLNGSVATYASMGNPNPELPFYLFLFRGATFHLVNVYELPNDARSQAIRDITSLLESNELKHLIAARFELKDIVAAHQLVEGGTAIGNVVINVIQE
ncbi:MAG TPA: NADPH:quinone reductase [Gammaproteobacteria bacterium]|nr:NADPH:quinone reductase [Gammaproteobacteria bacterium]